jgi:hypothetical protein
MTTRRSEAAAPEWRGQPFNRRGGHSQARRAAKDRGATESTARGTFLCQLSARAALSKGITAGLARHEDTINLCGHVA